MILKLDRLQYQAIFPRQFSMIILIYLIIIILINYRIIKMYAVVKTGGKQYRVQKEDVVLVEKLNANDGDQLVLSDVLMVGDGKK